MCDCDKPFALGTGIMVILGILGLVLGLGTFGVDMGAHYYVQTQTIPMYYLFKERSVSIEPGAYWSVVPLVVTSVLFLFSKLRGPIVAAGTKNY